MVSTPAGAGTVTDLQDELVLGSGMSMFRGTNLNKIMTTSGKRIFCYIKF